MLPCHSCYIYGTWRTNNIEGLKLSYGRKGKKSQRGSIFVGPISHKKLPGELTPQLVYLNYLPIQPLLFQKEL